MRENLIKCFSSTTDESDCDKAISDASSLKKWLEDLTFLFFLDVFHQIFPHIDLLFSVFQARKSSIALVAEAVKACTLAISAVRSEVDEITETYRANSTLFIAQSTPAGARGL